MTSDEVAGLRNNLTAVRALIDTPEKYLGLGMHGAVLSASLNGADETACIEAIRNAKSTLPTDWADHRSVMARLDRAIANPDATRRRVAIGGRKTAYQQWYYRAVTKPRRLALQKAST